MAITGPAVGATGSKRLRGLLWVALFLSIAIPLGLWVDSLGGPEAFAQRFGLAAPFLTVPVHTILSVTPFPSELFVLANGTAYGWLWGGLLGWLGWSLASMLEYTLAARTSKDLDLDAQIAKLPPALQKLPVDHPLFLILGRQVPFGFHVVNILAGVKRISPWRHLWCSAVGSVPGAVLYAGLGAGVLSLI
jgi:uncharacterized membrane protein YdjX (TVP38/TMEM64 family)